MPYKEVDWDAIARGNIGQSLNDLNKRRKQLQETGAFTQAEADRVLIPHVRRAILDIAAKRKWAGVDALIMGQWLFTKTGVTMYDKPVDANAAQHTHNVLRITRF